MGIICDTGRKSDIDITPTKLRKHAALVDEVREGVEIFSSWENTGIVWVGTRNSITANENDSTDGFPLLPGASVLIRAQSIGDIYVMTDSTDIQTIWFIGV